MAIGRSCHIQAHSSHSALLRHSFQLQARVGWMNAHSAGGLCRVCLTGGDMSAKFSRFLWILTATVLIAYGSRGSGQGIVTGSISGTVEDPSSAVIAGATVTATQVGTNSVSKAVSNSAGEFRVAGLPIGLYTVTIEFSGFTPLKVQ